MMNEYAKETGFQSSFNFLSKIDISKRAKPKLLEVIEDVKPRFPSFTNTVRKGDILITGQGLGGLVGHAAIMISDYWVLEMPGGEGWQFGIEDNNRRISKYDWYDLHHFGWKSVFRNRDLDVAHAAADWAERNYYNPHGGSEKTQHITYKLTNEVWSTDPSYCSKLVVQAYHLGTGNRKVIRDFTVLDHFIPPNAIPSYFLPPYTLERKGLFSIFP